MQNNIKNKLNIFCEFKDKELETAFFDAEFTRSKQSLRKIILAFGVIYFVISIFDFFYSTNTTAFTVSLAVRSVSLLFSIALFFMIHRIKRYKSILIWITIFEVYVVASYSVILMAYGSKDLFSQCLTFVVFLQALFLLPNRWINSMIMAAATFLFFFIFTSQTIQNLRWQVFVECMIMMSIAILFLGIFTYRIQSSRRLEFDRQRALERLSETDELTGAYNRRQCDVFLAYWCDLSARYQIPFSIIYFDIDNFKAVNDTYGHHQGDIVLTSFASIVRGMARSSDQLARCGGEEFALLLPQTSLQAAIDLAQRICIGTRESYLDPVGHVTASFGVATHLPNETAQDLLAKADRLMYKAKKAGKNQVQYQ